MKVTMNPLDPLYKVKLENAILERQLHDYRRSPWKTWSHYGNLASILTLVVAVVTIVLTMTSGIIDDTLRKIELEKLVMEARRDSLTVEVDKQEAKLDSLKRVSAEKDKQIAYKESQIAGRVDKLKEYEVRYKALIKEKAETEARLLLTIDEMNRNMPTFDEYKARFIRDEELKLLRTAVDVCDQSKDPRYGSSLGEFIHSQFFAGRSLDMELGFCKDMKLQELVEMLEKRTPDLPK